MKHEETARRLRRAMAEINIKAQELAEKSNVSKVSISQYVNGTHVPSNVSAGKMALVLGVNPVWLMGYDVPQKLENNENFDLDASEIALIRAYRQAPESDQRIIRKILDMPEKGQEIQEQEQYYA